MKWLDVMDYKVRKDELFLLYSSHPNSGTLLSITDTLVDLGIENIALNIPFESLYELDDTFLALIKKGDSQQFVYAKMKNVTQIQLFNGELETSVISISHFKQLYNGMIVVIERNHQPVNRTLPSKSAIGIFILTVSVSLFLYWRIPVNLSNFLFWLLAIVGLVFSILLYKVELGSSNELLQRFCTFSSKSSCNAVLNSPSSKMFPGFSYVDIGILYFSFQTLSVSFTIVNDRLLYGISIAASLFLFYSIYQQAFVIKKWCLLCLSVLAVLLLQGIIAFLNRPNIWQDERFIYYFARASSVLILLSVSWKYFKLIVEKGFSLKNTQIELQSFKRSSQLFLPAYQNATLLDDTTIKNVPQILSGNSESFVQLTLITNPLCKACSEAHKSIEALCKKYDIKVRLVFFVPEEQSQETKGNIAKWLFYQYIEDEKKGNEIISQWYQQPDFSSINFLNNFTCTEFDRCRDYLNIQYKWCIENEITTTPTILINNKRISSLYTVEDLKYHISELIKLELRSDTEDTSIGHATAVLINNT